MPEELRITVDRVCYPPESTEGAKWFIIAATVKLPEDSEQDEMSVTVKGEMGWRPKPQERLKLSGKWATYQGKREFKFASATLDLPTDSRGLLHYVCEMASGVGASMEAQIWDLMGERWADIQERALPRLSGRVYQNFMEAIERAEADREKGAAIAQLLAAGATMNLATAAWEMWGDATLGKVASDPYCLAHLRNFGFADVDGRIRVHYGIGDSDPRRIRAAIVYVLKQITDGGSTLVTWDALNKACLAKLGGYQALITAAVREMFEEGTLIGFREVGCLALARDHANERLIWDFLNAGEGAA